MRELSRVVREMNLIDARSRAGVPAELCPHGIDATRKCSICAEDARIASMPPNRWLPAECGCTYPTRRCAECDLAMDAVHAEALAIHLRREALENRVLIVTGGELHDWSAAPKADFVLNLSRVLRDPAHVPSGEMLDMRGDLDLEVYEFVMNTKGARQLWSAWVVALWNSAAVSPIVVHVKCRGGKHRAPAFGTALHSELWMMGGDAAIFHLHAHLDRVIAGEKPC